MPAAAEDGRHFVDVDLALGAEGGLILPLLDFHQADAHLDGVDGEGVIDDALGIRLREPARIQRFQRDDGDGELVIEKIAQAGKNAEIELGARLALAAEELVGDAVDLRPAVRGLGSRAEGVAVDVRMRKTARIGDDARHEGGRDDFVFRHAEFFDELGNILAVARTAAHEIILTIARVGDVMIEIHRHLALARAL